MQSEIFLSPAFFASSMMNLVEKERSKILYISVEYKENKSQTVFFLRNIHFYRGLSYFYETKFHPQLTVVQKKTSLNWEHHTKKSIAPNEAKREIFCR